MADEGEPPGKKRKHSEKGESSIENPERMADEGETPGKKRKHSEKGESSIEQDANCSIPVPVRTVLSRELYNLQESIKSLLLQAKENFDLEKFLSTKVLKLGALIGHYYNALTSLNVQGRVELDKLIGNHYSDTGVKDAAEKLLEAEDDWDEFLKGIDERMDDRSDESLTIGTPGPCDLKLVDVKTEREITIRDLLSAVNPKSLVLILLRHFA